jgi:hypothetical protein
MLVSQAPRRYIGCMVIEVHTREKPAIPHRTWVFAVMSLVLASLLAGVMSRTRGGDPLGQRIEPTGWLISFRPPRWSGAWEFGATLFGPAFRFHSPTAEGGVATLVVYRIEGPEVGAAAVCDRILRADLGLRPKPVGWARFRGLDTQLGPFRAVEMFDPIVNRVVRAAEFGSAGVYAVSLKVQDGQIQPQMYHVFDQTCSSIEVRRN